MHTDKPRGFTLIELLVVIAIIAILAAILFPVFAQAKEQAKKTACLSNMKQIGLAAMMYVNDSDGVYPVNNWTFGLNWQGCQVGWKALLQPYIKNVDIFRCPSAPQNLNGALTTIPGPGGTVDGSVVVPWGQIGANEWIVSSVTPTVPIVSWKGNVNESQLGRPAELVFAGDSVEGTFQDAPMIFNANFNLNSWWDVDVVPNPQEARHTGGSSLDYGDGHAKYMPQGRMAWNPTLVNFDGTQCPANPELFATLGYCWNIPLNPKDPRVQ